MLSNKLSFIFVDVLARERPKGFPRGEAVKIGFSEPILTDEECGQKSWITTQFQTFSGLNCYPYPHPSSKTPVPAAFESTFPQGKALVR